MKKFFALLLAAVIALSALGCGSSAPTQVHGDSVTTGSFPVTDTVTHQKDPDISFTHRHVGYTFEDAVWDDFNKDNNTDVQGYYCVVYGDDTHAVGMTEYWVMSSEAEAQKWLDLQKGLYITADIRGNVVIFTNDRAAIEGAILEMQSFDVAVEDTCESFWQLMVEMNSLVPMQ